MEHQISPGVRTVARNAVRAHIADAALGLFISDGYEATTIDDVCAAAGISRSTFFRYFHSKDELMLGHIERFGQRIADALAAQGDDEPLWQAIRRAFDGLIDEYAASPGAAALARVVSQTPALRVAEAGKSDLWLGLLGPEIARRLGVALSIDEPRPAAIVAATIGAVAAAMSSWADAAETRSLEDLLDIAMSPFGL
ncbi:MULTISPECIES: TetR family transcriptional regulator [Bifidobacterium]|jgi:AcrR family transcriptional regulator|uniref:TetR family transcriptional regulator n=1 Tax=Bifidobacterium tibiigranuli TaxID=2172043 RepID=A0A5N6S1T2_9BIFI|nr:TetR family transcriptional regulator [Bifidobacterium tibiigranuli]KAE8127146.1 TetR family transcriptional regulator [Bifidobacterium tibiigranuli]KAE8127631.1 TetR family transcriptional regulator [Bifidobacterium tibiigranuli]MCH3974220.1 TetR family transcriptional regulator [Bifidobacterium tibiigranuli]MCH4188783.1 TetR family transcriptional regulator [Bifidobacterium tibiigranuli]MCH4203312.1 TetR family transcriptional regulator [Bifidobacterium tibiigranuli]